MPEGSKVEKIYRALRDKGYSKEKAAKIAQAQTGLALATGEPPKHENEMIENECFKRGQDKARSEIEGIMNRCRK